MFPRNTSILSLAPTCLAAIAPLAAQTLPTRPLVAVGDSAPGAVAGAFFKYLQEPFCHDLGVAFRGGLALPGDRLSKVRAVKDGGRGIWMADRSGVRLVALEDQPAPGIERAVFDNFPTLVLGPAGHVAFVATLKPMPAPSRPRSNRQRRDADQAIPTGAREALYIAEAGRSPRLLFRSGDPVPGLPNQEWRSFDYTAAVPSLAQSGLLALRATSTIAATTDHAGVWLIDQGSGRLVAGPTTAWPKFHAYEGVHAPQVATNGTVLFGSETADRQPVVVRVRDAAVPLGAGSLQRIFKLAPTDSGDAICVAKTKDTPAGNQEIYRLGDHGVERIVSIGARIASPAPDSHVTRVTTSWDVAGDGSIVFLGSTDCGEAVLLSHGGNLTVIGRANAPIPDAGGSAESIVFDTFSPMKLACNRRGQAVFFATTRQTSLRGDPALATKNLFGWDGRQCRSLARVGGMIDVGGGRMREVMALELVEGRPLADDGSVRVVVTWKRAAEDPKEADIGLVDGRCLGIYTLSLGSAAAPAVPSAAPGQAHPAEAGHEQRPEASPPAAASVPPAPSRAEPEPRTAAARLALPPACWRGGELDAAALTAASHSALEARDRHDRKVSPLGHLRYHVRSAVLADLGRRAARWPVQQQQIEQRQAQLQEIEQLGQSPETVRLAKEIDSLKQSIAASKESCRDTKLARRAADRTLLEYFFVDVVTKPSTRPHGAGRPLGRERPGTSQKQPALVEDMEWVRQGLAQMVIHGAGAADKDLILKLNGCCQRIAEHARSGDWTAAQGLCDAVVAWILNDEAPLPGG